MMKIPHNRLSNFISILAALVPECRLTIAEDGWNTGATDTANVAMVQVRLPKESFDEYLAEHGEIGMDVLKWKTLFGTIMADPKSTIEMQREGARLRFSDGKWSDAHTPLDPTTVRKRPNPPNIALPSGLEIDAREYNESVKAMGVIGDKVRLSITGTVLKLETEGDTDRLQKEIPGELPPGHAANPGTVTSLFSIDYLKDTAKAMKDAGKITVHAANNHPLRFDFDLDTMEVTFLIAPRIEMEA